MRQLDIELVTVGPSHAEHLRSIWLEMLVGSFGVSYERLDEAMALRTEQWRERAAQLSSPSSTVVAAVSEGAFVGMISGYIDQAWGQAEGQISHFHVASGPTSRDRVASRLLRAFSEWLVDRGAEQVVIGMCEDQVVLLDQLLGFGFVPTATRRRCELDPDHDEVELIRSLGGVAATKVVHPTGGVRRATSTRECRYRVG